MKVTNKTAAQLTSTIQKKESPFQKGLKNSENASKAGALDPGVVKLSPRAQNIRRASEIAKADTVDEKKIAKFQNLIDSGKYNVDSAKVADRLIDEHLKMTT